MGKWINRGCGVQSVHWTTWKCVHGLGKWERKCFIWAIPFLCFIDHHPTTTSVPPPLTHWRRCPSFQYNSTIISSSGDRPDRLLLFCRHSHPPKDLVSSSHCPVLVSFTHSLPCNPSQPVRSSVCPIKLFVCLLVGLPASVLTSMCLLVFSVLVT